MTATAQGLEDAVLEDAIAVACHWGAFNLENDSKLIVTSPPGLSYPPVKEILHTSRYLSMASMLPGGTASRSAGETTIFESSVVTTANMLRPTTCIIVDPVEIIHERDTAAAYSPCSRLLVSSVA